MLEAFATLRDRRPDRRSRSPRSSIVPSILTLPNSTRLPTPRCGACVDCHRLGGPARSCGTNHVEVAMGCARQVAGGAARRWPLVEACHPAIAYRSENLGADPNGSEFADGLTDELTRQLTMIRGLDVRSRTSSFVFRTGRSIYEIGRQLRADYLLTSSVLHAGERVRIIAQLVRVSDDATVWAATIERNVNDLFNIQDEISRSIINQLQVKLDRLPRRYDSDAATYERYLRARSLSERKDRSSLLTAITYYKEVIAADANFAPAYAGLADAYADYEFWGVNYEAAYSEVKNAASKALELDPQLPEAHAAMGLVHARDRHWQDAEREFQRSIQINPNRAAPPAHGFWTLYQEGKLADASKELQLALRNDASLDVRRMMAYVESARVSMPRPSTIAGMC